MCTNGLNSRDSLSTPKRWCMQVLASVWLLAISLHAGAQASCQTHLMGQSGTLTQSGAFCVVAITTGSEAPQLAPAGVFGIYDYAPFAMDATGDVFFLAGGDAGGNGYNLYEATGSTAQTQIYASPAFASQTDASPLAQAGSFLGVDANYHVSFYGQGATQSGIYAISASTGQPQPLATISNSENGNGYPQSTSVLNSVGQLAFWMPIPEFNPSLGCRPYQLAIAQLGASPADLPVATTCGGFLPPAINDKGEVVYAFNSPVNIDGVTQPGLQASVDFYVPLTASGNDYSFTNSSELSALAGYSTSVLALNDNEQAAAILSKIGAPPELVVINFAPTTNPNPGVPGVTLLVQGGAVGGPYGGALCGTPAIDSIGQVLFISGSSNSNGICGSSLYLANPNGTAPQLIIAAGDQFTDLSTGTTWTIASITGTSLQSLNDNCQVAAYVLATAVPNNIEQPFIVRADALPGVCSVQVPNVVGDTQAAATSALTTAGLELAAVTTQASTSIAPGLVINQNPSAGSAAVPGSAVSLVVSSGVSVPTVLGMPLAMAETTLTSAGLITGSVSQQYSTTVAPGNVLSESPAAGSSVAGGTAVGLVISEGPPPVQVPNVVGDTQTAAAAALGGAGLALGSVTQQASSSVPQGEVSGQSPPAGSSVPLGSAVNVIVSSGPPQISIVLASAPQFTYFPGENCTFCIPSSSTWDVTITLRNNGNITANTLYLGSFSLNGYSAITNLLIGSLAPGAAEVVTLTVPATEVTSGAGTLKLSGTDAAGTVNGNWSVSARISVPAP